MRARIALVVRIILGLMLAVVGLNKFLQFMPAMQMAPPAMNLMGALIASGYVMPMVAMVEIIVGALLLTNKFVPLALILLAPLSVNVVLFHLFLDPASIGPAALVTIMNIYLAYVNKDKYRPLLSARLP